MKITKHGFAIIEGDTHIGKWAEESGNLAHDTNMLPLVLKHIRRGETVIDAGAYIGDHTIAYAKAVGQRGHVYAFEPGKDAFECLSYNMKPFPQVTCVNAGLGAKFEKKGIVDVEGNIGMRHLAEGDDVHIHPIDELQFGPIHFIKIDCEGYELEVLKGAEKTISRSRPRMLIEINQMTLERQGIKRQDIFLWLQERNYNISNIYPNQDLLEYQFDLLCLPR